jgi:hypothetical protein
MRQAPSFIKTISILVLVLIAGAQAQNNQKVLNSEHITTLCALVDHHTEYSGKTVRLQAKVLSGPGVLNFAGRFLSSEAEPGVWETRRGFGDIQSKSLRFPISAE